MSGPSIQRAENIEPGGCPGGAEYGRGLSRTVVHAGGCCARWEVEHVQVDADELLADALELGEFDDGSRPDLTRWSR